MLIRARIAGRSGFPFRRDGSAAPGIRGLLVCVCAAQLVACAHFQPRRLTAGSSIAAFESRSLQAPGLLAFLAGNHLAAPPPGAPWTLKALTLAAFYYQPALAEARARLLSAQAARITAGERPNPSFSLAPGHDSPVAGSISPWIVPLSFDWPIETDGKRGDRLAEARHLAAAARWDLIGTVWRVRSRLRSALLDLYAAHRSELLLGQEVATRREIVRLLEGQLNAGNVSGYEVAQARIALQRVVLATQAAAGRARQARIALAAALGVPAGALTGVQFSFAELRAFPLDLTRAHVRQQALLGRADVRAALERYAASQSALQLQIARQWPDIHIGPGFAWNAQLVGDREWDLRLSLPLPILNHNQGPIAAARAQRALAAADFVTVQSAALTQIDGALAAYESTRAELTTAAALRRELARQLTAARAEVAAGEVQPLARVSARLAYERGAQERLNALLGAQRALGRLEDALQSPLTLAPAAVRAAQDGSDTVILQR